jgi:lysophospholipase L1-like esterase
MNAKQVSVRLATVAGGILAGFVLIEIILQIGSLVVWWTSRPSVPPAGAERSSDERIVLCVGDSFTFGSGASSPEMSYPAQLERLLQEAAQPPRRWTVRNAGWPGKNSGELLAELPGLTKRIRPDYVCLLVGLNNRWSSETEGPGNDGPGVLASGTRTFTWRWRTARLAAIVADAFRTRKARNDAAESRAGSSVEPPSGRRPAALERAQSLLAHPDSASVARDVLLDARSEIRMMNDPATSALLARLLFRLGLRSEAVEEVEHVLRSHGETPELCQAIVPALARLGRTEEAVRYAQRAVQLAPDDPQSYRGLALASKLAGNAGETVRALASGYALDGDAEYLERQFRRRQFSRVLTPQQVSALLEDLPMEDARRKAFLGLYRESREEVDFTSRLEADLLAACDLTRRAGATPLILTYPSTGVAGSAVETLTEVARAERVPLVNVIPAFDKELTTRRPEELFVPDGHCTDLGYGLMAQEVAAAILRLEGASR